MWKVLLISDDFEDRDVSEKKRQTAGWARGNTGQRLDFFSSILGRVNNAYSAVQSTDTLRCSVRLACKPTCQVPIPPRV